ncbi:hypothetical protein KAFR_0I01060 [Kazachstania africana CBS 2517]|uniref:non-specific serine/threonine protein kinase n=1 Tax=Kazachstania africana (strain ATCC 22294 / BCRC 22015 / CBS 2517 / CECT 1963 / NBRC 1671 / NRRL Y-8276) TaxID=1071382 RepID=H2AZT7_KAZAF|nr:hypothetical protein KAFR_0I01060 [Kazachstania africana CBS 2517]CCF59887.1 hypothetical protein KAFR_0I01060 [Kazachstania africana CBS 2517]
MVISDDDEESLSLRSNLNYKTPTKKFRYGNVLSDVDSNILNRSTKKSTQDKKRWSLLSNHSSSKAKRSLDHTPSRATTASNVRDSKYKKRMSSGSSTKRASLNSPIDNTTSKKVSDSLKRSSTGSSLRQLLTRMVTNDSSIELDKENQHTAYRSPEKNTKSTINNDSDKERSRRFSLATSYINQINESMDNLSIQSNASSGSKWKFWKKSSASEDEHSSLLSHSFSMRSLRISSNNSNNSILQNISEENSSFPRSTSQMLNKKRSNGGLSVNILKKRASHGSLKHKSSHSSLQKLKYKCRTPSAFDNSPTVFSSSLTPGTLGNSINLDISLPIPDQVSRDKIRTKLKNSTSLLSLNSSVPISLREYDENMMQLILEQCSIKHILDKVKLSTMADILEVLSIKDSTKLSSSVWRTPSRIDPSETIVCKKVQMETSSSVMTLHELQVLNLCKGTPGFPYLLQSYIVLSNEDHANKTLQTHTLYLFFKDCGEPLSKVSIKSWQQCLKIFWQCTTIIYVAETKFGFEHRNLTFDHILVDSKGNITLCDMESSRANDSTDNVFFTKLDHPIFYQNDENHAFENYQIMRSFFTEHKWGHFEPRTSLLWLRYICHNFIMQNKLPNSSDKVQLLKLIAIIEDNIFGKKPSGQLFRRKETEICCTGDLMRLK